MQLNFLTLFTALLIGSNVLSSNQVEEKNTFVHMYSFEGDYIGGGKTQIYEKEDGKLTVVASGNVIKADFKQYSKKIDYEYTDNWSFTFKAPGEQSLKPGLYLNGLRFPFGEKSNPKLDISGCGRGCNGLSGDFRILELTLDKNGVVESFAVNASQRCESLDSSPLFTCIRFNSNIPVEASVSDIYGKRCKPDSFFCYKKENSDYAIFQSSTTDDFDYKFYSNVEEGVIIDIEPISASSKSYENIGNNQSKRNSWNLEFTTFNESGLKAGLEENSELYPKVDYPSCRCLPHLISITTGHNGFTSGKYKVLSIEKDKYGRIEELAINFQVADRDGKNIEGAIRYRSDIPVNLEHPFETAK